MLIHIDNWLVDTHSIQAISYRYSEDIAMKAHVQAVLISGAIIHGYCNNETLNIIIHDMSINGNPLPALEKVQGQSNG